MPPVSISYQALGHFHGDNTGSNPVGDANKTKDLEEIEPSSEGLRGFDNKNPLSGFISPILLFPHDLPRHPAVCRAFYIGDGLRVHIHRHLEVGVAEKFLDRLHVLPVGLHQGSEGVSQGVPSHRFCRWLPAPASGTRGKANSASTAAGPCGADWQRANLLAGYGRSAAAMPKAFPRFLHPSGSAFSMPLFCIVRFSA
jgi:hypothetical protein